MTYLLDANVLLALLWKPHAHHTAVRDWLAAVDGNWATTPLTQLAFVRLLSLNALTAGQVTPTRAMEVLERDLLDPRHVFWPADIEFVGPVRSACQPLVGGKQTTDAYLVVLSQRHGGKLATLDRGILELVKDKPGQDFVELIEAPAADLDLQ